MRAMRIGLAPLLSTAMLFGCGGKALPAAEEAAVREAVVKHYEARRDKKREVRIKEIVAAPEGARARVAVKYPDFHSVATEHVLSVKKTDSGWTVDDKAGGH